MYYDSNKMCWGCGSEFSESWKALRVQGAATRGRVFAFHGLACLLYWAQEEHKVARKVAAEVKREAYPQVIVQGDELRIIPPIGEVG